MYHPRGTTHEAPGRNPISVILRMCIVNPLDPAQKVYAQEGDLTASGLNVPGEFYFPVDESAPIPDRLSMLDVHEVDRETRYIITASHDHCETITSEFTILCNDGTDTGLAIAIPCGFAIGLFAYSPLKKSLKKQSCVKRS